MSTSRAALDAILSTTFLALSASAQPLPPVANLLAQFDNQHNLAAKEQQLRDFTQKHTDAGASLLQLAESTANLDTRWLAMRGLVTLHYTGAAPFLEASLKHPDPNVRANAARALGDLRITSASDQVLAMFAAETDRGAIEQASLALTLLNVRSAAPSLREKIPSFTGQTRIWLMGALGVLGNASQDVRLLADYLNGMEGDAAAGAIGQLTGVNFGGRKMGLTSFPTAQTLVARAWWDGHKAQWPRCDDCRLN